MAWRGLVGGLIVAFILAVVFQMVGYSFPFEVAIFSVGVLLVYFGSEFSVVGFKELSLNIGVSGYFAGLTSSIASNLPELVVSILILRKAMTLWDSKLAEVAVLSVVTATGFNSLLLGLLIVMVTVRTGALKFPYEAIRHESHLIRLSIVVSILIFALGVIEWEAGSEPVLPRPVGVFLLLIYAVYVFFMYLSCGSGGEEPSVSFERAAIYSVAGVLLIFIGGHLISGFVEEAVSRMGLSVVSAALIVGASGSVPEHAIALIGAIRGELELSLGNLIAGMIQCILIIFGLISVFTQIVLDGFILFQFVAVAGILWIVKKAILDDGQLTIDEGLFIIILQTMLFILLEELRV